MKKLFFLCLSFYFLTTAQAQISNLEVGSDQLTCTTNYKTNFWSYHAPIEVEYFDRQGIAFNPDALRKQTVTFLGDSLSINFMEQDYFNNPAILKIDSLEKNPSIKIINYGSATLNSDTASFEYTITGKKGGTQIELNLKEPTIIRIEEGATYKINIQLFNTKEAMKPGAYLPKSDRRSFFKS